MSCALYYRSTWSTPLRFSSLNKGGFTCMRYSWTPSGSLGPVVGFSVSLVGRKPSVRALAKRLRESGMAPWLDEEQLMPGQDWELEIRKAVRASDAVVVCLSKSSLRAAYS
jgi:hypothetical protein